MNNQKNTGRAVAGFFLTLITIIMLAAGGGIAALKLSILNCSDIDEFFDNIDFYSTVQEIVVSEIKNRISDDGTQNGTTGGLTENVVDKLLTEDIVKDMTNSITDAITNDKEIDLGNVKDKCIDKVTDLSNQAVDDILDEISRTSDVVNIDTLQSSTVLQQYQKDYNVDIMSLIVNEIENVYGEPSVSLEKIDIDEVKAKTKTAVIDSAVPMIEESIGTYIDEANKVADAQVAKIKESGELSHLTAALKVLISLANIALAILVVIAVAASLVQIFVVYGSKKSSAFRNIAIATGVSSAILMISGGAINFVRSMLGSVFGNNSSEEILKKFADSNISKISGDMFVVGSVFAVIFVSFICASLFMKKRSEK